MMAPNNQDTYNKVIERRLQLASMSCPSLFGTPNTFVEGSGGRRCTPLHLKNDREFTRVMTGCDSAPISTYEEKKLFNRLMSANPLVGKKGGCSWSVILDLWNAEIMLDKKGIFGKTSEQLQRHHANEWSTINSKLKALKEGSDALKRLRKAVGSLGRTMDSCDTTTLDPERALWDGVETVKPHARLTDNPLIPRVPAVEVQPSLFGMSLNPTLPKKRGRRPGIPNRCSRRSADCAVVSCTHWYDCSGSYRKRNCLFATVRPFSFHTPRQVQKRRETFDYIHRNDPSLSKAEVALEVAKILCTFD
jgi:hypothetical protein